MMRTLSATSAATPSMDFAALHDIMRDHIHRGNNFAVLATLALSVVHENPAFWQTCTYRNGIAAAVLASCIERRGTKHLQSEAGATETSTASTAEEGPLTESELYILLRRIDDNDAILRRVIDQLEEGSAPSNHDDMESSDPRSVETQIDLDMLCAVLRERCRSCNEERDLIGDTGAASSSATTTRMLKRPRGSDAAEERHVVFTKESTSTSTADDSRGEVDSDALNVLAQLPALPGSTRAVASFDAVGDFVNQGDGERVETGNQRFGCRSFHCEEAMGCAPIVELRPRQRRHKFTPEEDEAILRGVARYAQGIGRFESIFYAYRGVWHPDRTPTQLHDHWRGTLRQRAVLEQGGYRGKNSLASRRGGGGNIVDSDVAGNEKGR
ncbi:TTAGGG binding factor [Trypanosoma grayi]|uniref:TTAGGG binding factor n=1 Tax=Trypanosoma grayi TaxID=71804 RepID=UPI0004F48A95|nr:TTAGGG binding factor [Trypanosoma grayi]KEG15139.1 TTAGGG binding factor [Trypanosoma grayi]